MGFINKITLPAGNTYNLEGTAYSVAGTQAAATNAWTGSCNIDELKDGVTIAYLLPFNGTSAAATLNLTLADGSYTGAIPVYMAGTVVTQQFKAHSVIIMRYNATAIRWETNTFTDEGKTYTFTSGSGGDASFQVSESGGTPVEVKVGDVDTTVTQNSGNLVTSGAVWTAIDALPEPMVFRGTVGESAQNPTILWSNLPSPSTSNHGDTYKVVTAHATAPICIVGDVITSNGVDWVVITSGDDPGAVDTWRNILVNGLEKMGTAINSGGIDFVDGTNTEITWDNTNKSIQVDVPKTKTHISATASGMAITPTKSNAVTSYPGTTSNLVTSTASKATAGTAISVNDGTLGAETSAQGTNSVMFGATVNNEVLSFTWKPINTTSIIPYTFADVTVATGALSGSGEGSVVMTGLGTPVTGEFVTGIGSIIQPNITIASGNSGDVEVVTDIGPSA